MTDQPRTGQTQASRGRVMARAIIRPDSVMRYMSEDDAASYIDAALAEKDKRIAELEASYKHVKTCMHTAEERSQSAEIALSKVEDLLVEFGEDSPGSIGEYLAERSHNRRSAALLSAAEKGSG